MPTRKLAQIEASSLIPCAQIQSHQTIYPSQSPPAGQSLRRTRYTVGWVNLCLCRCLCLCPCSFPHLFAEKGLHQKCNENKSIIHPPPVLLRPCADPPPVLQSSSPLPPTSSALPSLYRPRILIESARFSPFGFGIAEINLNSIECIYCFKKKD